MKRIFTLTALGMLCVSAAPAGAANGSIELTALSSVAAITPGVSAAEIAAHDPATQRIFVVNAVAAKIDVFDISNPAQPQPVGQLEVQGDDEGAIANSVAVKNGIIAVAVEANPKTNPGKVVFFDSNLNLLSEVQVGAQPDMVTFTPNGRYVVTANEGEPAAYPSTPISDPEGSVSIIDLAGGAASLTPANVRTAAFTAFNGFAPADLFAADNIRVFGPGASVAQDLEPEYIATSHDSQTAWVTLQEANAIAIVDIPSATVTELRGLGVKNHNVAGQGLDASDRDSRINIATWPVFGLYESDAIASYSVGGQTYLVFANEGDVRADWPGYNEETRVNAVTLDPTAFPNGADLKKNGNLGRLKITAANGDTDGDGDYDQLYSFGGRSFTIRTANGDLVWDSGDQFEQITAERYPANFNASNNNNTFDDRSDDKGPEPEGIAVGKVFGRDYAFVAIERIGGIMVYDISNPHAPEFVQYVNNRNLAISGTAPAAGDLGPEGVIVISEENSPNGKPLVVVANEVSGTTTIFEITKKK